MKVVVQRVFSASVKIDEVVTSEIDRGFLLYVCFESHDQQEVMDKAIKKITALRIFEDENGKMNKSIKDVDGKILSISQFTLSWDGRKGNRPSFDLSMEPEKARKFYDEFNAKVALTGLEIKTGAFGADMKVQSINDGPVTFHLSF